MDKWSDKKPRPLVNVYATRLGRLCYLQHYCGKTHPVFITETHLLQMAESKLREQLYVLYGVSGLDRQRVKLEKKIKSMAKHKISEQIEDDTARDKIFSIIDEANLEYIFMAH